MESTVKRVQTANLIVGFRVTRVRITKDKRTCTVAVEFVDKSTGDVISESLLVKVNMSRLVSERITNNPAVYRTKEWVRSLSRSEDFKENPYQLIRYKDKTSGEPEYLLCTVDERKVTFSYQGELPGGGSIYTPVIKKHSKSYYRRYRDAYGKAVRKEQEKK